MTARQPLPTAVIDSTKAQLKLGLDVHLEFIMGEAQRDHGSAYAPRKFTPEQLVEQVRKWVREGLQVFCVQEVVNDNRFSPLMTIKIPHCR